MLRSLLFISTLLFAISAQAVEPVYSSWGKAIKGYDTVAYFTESKPVKGDKNYQVAWNGATWYFASEANASLFKANPTKYAPQYGGYCAYAVSQGYTAKISPKAWKVVDGKLYLNYNQSIAETWSEDIPGYISAGDKNWPNILNK